MTRIVTALVGIPLVLLCLFWPGGWPWFALVCAITLMGVYEYSKALADKGTYVHWLAMAVVLAVVLLVAFPGTPGQLRIDLYGLLGWAPAAGHIVPTLIVLVVLAGDLAWARRSPIRNVGATLFGVAWLGLFGFLLALRADSAPLPGGYFVLAVLLVIWANDSAAYFIGKAWGRHKCAPAVSPNKTWEGIIAGLTASSVVGAALAPLAPAAFATTTGAISSGLLFGLFVGIAGQLGDLVESAVKRELGIKDFGSLLPGHGGVLDRFDSLMFAAPVALFLIELMGVRLHLLQ